MQRELNLYNEELHDKFLVLQLGEDQILDLVKGEEIEKPETDIDLNGKVLLSLKAEKAYKHLIYGNAMFTGECKEVDGKIQFSVEDRIVEYPVYTTSVVEIVIYDKNNILEYPDPTATLRARKILQEFNINPKKKFGKKKNRK